MPSFSLVIPIYNEVGNIHPLVKAIREKREATGCPDELILVNNGSTDRSADELSAATKGLKWGRIVTLNPNVGYGGGIQRGLESISPLATHVGWIPADLQYSIDDLYQVWLGVGRSPQAMHKGERTVRLDGKHTRFVSFVYTRLVKNILGVHVRDVNGLPKIIPVTLLRKIDFRLASTFLLDGQLILACELAGLPIEEHPVTFYARRAGVSSWSSKRLTIYRETFLELFRLRRESKRWFKSSPPEPSQKQAGRIR